MKESDLIWYHGAAQDVVDTVFLVMKVLLFSWGTRENGSHPSSAEHRVDASPAKAGAIPPEIHVVHENENVLINVLPCDLAADKIHLGFVEGLGTSVPPGRLVPVTPGTLLIDT